MCLSGVEKVLCNKSFIKSTVFHCKYCSFTKKRYFSEFVGLSDVIYVFHENNWLFVFHLRSGKRLSLSDQYRVNQRNVQVFHLTQSLQRSHRCLSNPRAPGIHGENLSHTSHDRLSKMENKKPRVANCHRKKLNESSALFSIFVHLPVHRFPLRSSFRVDKRTESFDVYLNIIV